MQREYLSKERRQFYRSKAWQQCRAGYWEYRHGICERCGRVASQVHHRIYLTDANLRDPEISLAWENLELLCDKCHAEEHHGGGFQTGEGYSFNEYGDLVYNPPVESKK